MILLFIPSKRLEPSGHEVEHLSPNPTQVLVIPDSSHVCEEIYSSDLYHDQCL